MGGMILGTAAYMAPEQAKGKPVDKRADIWAFGCVLYEMVTARRPFDGEDITDTIAAVVSKEPDWSPVPAPLTRLMQQCLQKDPRKRLRDVGDAWSLIDDAPRVPNTTIASRGPLISVLAGAAAVAIIAAGAVAYVHFSEQPPAAPTITRLHMALPAGAAPDLNMQISPDGRRLAYLGRGADGVLRVYLRALDELEASPIAGTEGTGSGSLFWSPDSRWLAFMNQQRLKKFDVVGGGSPQMIADVSGANVIGGAWNRDGVIVFGSNPMSRPGSGGCTRFLRQAEPLPQSPASMPNARKWVIASRPSCPTAGDFSISVRRSPRSRARSSSVISTARRNATRRSRWSRRRPDRRSSFPVQVASRQQSGSCSSIARMR